MYQKKIKQTLTLKKLIEMYNMQIDYYKILSYSFEKENISLKIALIGMSLIAISLILIIIGIR